MDPEYFRAKAFVHLISGSPKETLAVSIKLCKWVSYGEENVVSLNVSSYQKRAVRLFDTDAYKW